MNRPDKTLLAQAASTGRDLMHFLDASPSCFHAVDRMSTRLEEAGFVRLDERERFKVEPNGKYFVIRADSSAIAFQVGEKPPSESGFLMVGAHTDSPGFKIKPRPEEVEQDSGIIKLGVEVYGGPLRVTWMDRDLGICGRVMLDSGERVPESRLYKSDTPLVTVPNLALHLNRDANDNGLKVNPQTELAVILGTAGLDLPEKDAVRHLVSRSLGKDRESILAYDLFLYDAQPASLGGAAGEFIRSSRIDDLAMCHAGLVAFLDVTSSSARETRILACLDSEETGSQTMAGAKSTFLPSVLERVVSSAFGDDRDGFWASLARSVMLSADNAHCRHPGYLSRYDSGRAPFMNMGPVLKVHASKAYATDAVAEALFQRCCRKAGVPVQRFVNRSDYKSGSTIGSMTSAQLGIPVADVGIAQWAMHSARETAGILDHFYMIQAMKAFFQGA